jgi:hypothetical protein
MITNDFEYAVALGCAKEIEQQIGKLAGQGPAARAYLERHHQTADRLSGLLAEMDAYRDPAARIPITAAKAIADKFDQRQVIIVTWDGATTHVVTYGRTVAECEQAARGGNKVKAALGWPPKECTAVPARSRKKRAGP